LAAAAYLWEEGVAANVLALTSPRQLFAGWRASKHLPAWLISAHERHAPIITVQDGAAHSLAWLGSVYGAPVTALGVEHFGQSGSRAMLYQHYGIDAMSIAEAAFEALEA
jgi:pyruvate dehydrogenase E1 component